jgi:hypothetical protein
MDASGARMGRPAQRAHAHARAIMQKNSVVKEKRRLIALLTIMTNRNLTVFVNDNMDNSKGKSPARSYGRQRGNNTLS